MAVGMWGKVRVPAVGALAACLLGGMPAQAQQCVAQFQQNAEQYHKNLGICAQRHRLMDGVPELVKLYQEMERKSPYEWQTTYYKQSGKADPSYTARSTPDYKVKVADDPAGRWKSDATTTTFNCSVPLGVQAQDESFMECARVYSCALQASSCAIVEAHRTNASDCDKVANQCLQKHRIPGMASLDTRAAPATPIPQGTTKGSSPRTPPPATTQAPPNPVDGLSAACKAQINQFLQAADRGDTVKATAAYEALRANCDGAMRQLAEAADVTLPERQMGRLSRDSFGRCLRGVDCGTAPSSPDQMAAAAANAFNVDEVMAVAFGFAGLAVGIAGVSGMYMPVAGGQIMQSNRFSTINQRARSTYGQGGPTHVAPRTVPSDITGIKK
jgi:hypothetical protein